MNDLQYLPYLSSLTFQRLTFHQPTTHEHGRSLLSRYAVSRGIV